MTRLLVIVLSSLALVVSAVGCAGEIPAPAPPRRPKAIPMVDDSDTARTDCSPTDPNRLLPAVPFDERSVDEADNLATQGYALLKQAESRNAEPEQRERLITDAVNRFITALLADPYNVHATYNLAAAYARIKRPQCAVNLLARLIPLRKHASQRDKVNEKLDRLLGRASFVGNLDPDFFEMRNDERFRELVKEFDPGAERSK